MRGQLPIRASLPNPAHRDRLIDRVPRHSVDQHPQRHLIRARHRFLTHERRPCQPIDRRRSHHAEPIKNYQVTALINLGYAALAIRPDDVEDVGPARRH
jgi:hypothetical protein